MRFADDERKLISLRMVASHLRVLESSFTVLLNTSLPRLASALLQASEMELFDVLSSSSSSSSSSSTNNSRKTLRYQSHNHNRRAKRVLPTFSLLTSTSPSSSSLPSLLSHHQRNTFYYDEDEEEEDEDEENTKRTTATTAIRNNNRIPRLLAPSSSSSYWQPTWRYQQKMKDNLTYPRKSFRHFRDQRIAETLVIVCRLLGYHTTPRPKRTQKTGKEGGGGGESGRGRGLFSDLHIVVDHFLGILTENKESGGGGSRRRWGDVAKEQSQAVFALNNLLLGACGILDDLPLNNPLLEGLEGFNNNNNNNDENNHNNDKEGEENKEVEEWKELIGHLAERLLEEYLSPGVWPLTPISLSFDDLDDSASPSSSSPSSSSVVILSLELLEGLGTIGKVLSGIGWRLDSFLMRSLYSILEMLGGSSWVPEVASSPIVKEYAWVTLNRLSLSLGKGSVARLVEDNLDFLVHTICQNLKVSQRTSRERESGRARGGREKVEYLTSPNIVSSNLS
jgi:uncharacterized membrane protein YgcG